MVMALMMMMMMTMMVMALMVIMFVLLECRLNLSPMLVLLVLRQAHQVLHRCIESGLRVTVGGGRAAAAPTAEAVLLAGVRA
mmetsp:Transcript_9181/g.24737  ORF Transcript_9181/g.24737 Transcript_9181/m.24737 type:complete len:82 (+) Transcript_9181:1-246(+)